MTLHRLSLYLCFSLLLCACGGGGGGGSDTGNTPSPPDPVDPPTPPPQVETFTVAGAITAADSQVADSDNNDPAREAISNNSIATAQPIPNPVTIGGYVNRPGSGADGRSTSGGDIDDYFRVTLLAGQRISMLVADPDDADADLYLYNEAGEVIDFSVDTGEIETITVGEAGDYLINAFAFNGATNYTLVVGTPESALDLNIPSRDTPAIVPWEAVVEYRQDNEIGASSVQTLDTRMGMQVRAGRNNRYRLMGLQRSAARQQLKARGGNATHKRDHIREATLAARWETLLAIKSLRADPMVKLAEPNYRIRAWATPNDEAYPLQWHYPLIGLPEAWDSTTGDENTIVAVIDTGVLPAHPDLLGQFVAGYDFVLDPDSAGDGNGIDANPIDPGDPQGGGSSFHGSHVSGTVAAAGDNNRGVAGVAYSSRVMPLRALGTDGGTTYDLGQAIRFAAGLANDSGTVPPQAADVINMSLGGAGFSQSMQNLIQEVRARGIIVVAAAGNEASSEPGYPAAYNGVVSVSAVDAQRRLAPYSNRGTTIDVAAPGGNSGQDLTGDGYPDGVLSTSANSSSGQLNYVYSFLNGTSMAAPHVAGVAALMKSINPDLSPADFDALLQAGAITDDLGSPGRDNEFGHGLINARLAVAAALESIGSSPEDIPRLVASASSVNFGANTNSLQLSLSNAGKGELNVLSTSASESWLSASPANVNSSGLGNYNIRVDREGLSAGVYAADLNINSSVNNVSVRVFMSVGGDDFSSDIGVLYILLLDPEEETPVAQVFSAGNDGVYDFRFDDVATGEYIIIAGSDADNDLLICDAGESCGAYLTTDQPISLLIESDMEGLNFPAEFIVALPTVGGALEVQTNATRSTPQKSNPDSGYPIRKSAP